jgi:hypothetical protein
MQLNYKLKRSGYRSNCKERLPSADHGTKFAFTYGCRLPPEMPCTSGRVSLKHYLCNSQENGKEDRSSKSGSDACRPERRAFCALLVAVGGL